MTTYIALLRGINVAGQRMVAMAELREFLAALGFREAQTILQSGNAVFTTKPQTTAKLERLLETEAERRIALVTDFFVRTAEEWAGVVDANPFSVESKRDPGHLLVLFAKDQLDGKRVEELQRAIRGREIVRGVGKQLYAVYPDGVGRSRLTTSIIDRVLGTRVTGRNWNTVLKLRDLASS